MVTEELFFPEFYASAVSIFQPSLQTTTMKKLPVLFTLLMTIISNLPAQVTMDSGLNGFWNDVNGMPLKMTTAFNVEGSPYFDDNYLLADIVFLNGKKYQDIKAKINLETNELIVLNSKNEAMIVGAPIKELILKAYPRDGKIIPVVLRGVGSVNGAINAKDAKIVEVLQDGDNFKLYRSYVISYNDSKAYGDASLTRKYNKNISFYGYSLNNEKRLERLGKNKNVIVAFFGMKKDQVKNFIDQNKLSLKSDDDLIQVFEFANTLK